MKQIEFKGTNNKYAMKKLLHQDNIVKKKRKDNFEISYLKKDQIQYVLNGCIEQKISNYKQQDKLKKMVSDIDSETIQQRLLNCDLKCFYCHEDVYVLYDFRREMTQWTLDRIDNALGHTNENTVVSCLKCNLKKRSRDHEKFRFATNLVITKSPDLPVSSTHSCHSVLNDEL
jgi:hypothetical protein